MEKIITDINYGQTIFNVPDSSLRKQIHEYCEKNNLYHLSYHDKNKEKDIRHSYDYYCPYCEIWKSIEHYKKKYDKTYSPHYCCEYECSSFAVVCDKCGSWLVDGDKLQKNVKKREIYYNNMIMISKKFEDLDTVFEKLGIKNKEKWYTKKKLKHNTK